jgi:hypothetical protein
MTYDCGSLIVLCLCVCLYVSACLSLSVSIFIGVKRVLKSKREKEPTLVKIVHSITSKYKTRVTVANIRNYPTHCVNEALSLTKKLGCHKKSVANFIL